jgi:hypothetical protein
MRVYIPKCNSALFLLPEILSDIGGKYQFMLTKYDYIIVTGFRKIEECSVVCNYIDSNTTIEDRCGLKSYYDNKKVVK